MSMNAKILPVLSLVLFCAATFALAAEPGQSAPSPLAAGGAPGDGVSELSRAAYKNDVAAVDALLRSGADVNAANVFGATPLYVAATYADAGIVEKLLAKRADPNKALLSGETPLMQAALRGRTDIVRALLKGGADINAKEAHGGQTALMWAVSEQHGDVAEVLVKSGADVRAHSKGGSTAIFFAAQQGDVKIARMLLEAGADANEKNPVSGFTPLLLASAMYNEEAVALLLDHKADPNATAGNGYAALHYAAWHQDALGIVKLLLKHKADPNIRLTQKKPSALTESFLSLQGATPLLLAAEINNLEAVRALVEAGADPSMATERGTTPLILAAGGGTFKAKPRSEEERAVAVETVKYLAEHGADVNKAGQYGYTALHAASYQGLNDVIAYLVGKGARLEAKDEWGQTPLSIANGVITKGMLDYQQAPHFTRKETADLLLSLGAMPMEKSGIILVSQRGND